MPGLLERVNRWLTPALYEQQSRQLEPVGENRYSLDTWISDYLIPSTFQYNGSTYPITGMKGSLAGNRAIEVSNSLAGYSNALRNCPPAFAAQLVRALVLSQARFTFRHPPWHTKTPRKLFSTPALQPLAKPWPNATTGELISRMEWHAGLAGCAFVAKQRSRADGTRLRVLRPDWTGIVWGSDSQPDNPGGALDGELLGYYYCNGGFANEWGYKPEFLLPDECVHWAPIPDPMGVSIGLSWLTSAIRDIQSDQLAGDHKIRYWENGATPNLVIKGLPAVTRTQFDELVEMMEERHAGAANAFRTLYLTQGADATVIGNNFHEIDFRAITAAGETRISVLSRVPASLLGISEGLQGSTLNTGNFAAARRSFADTWVYPTLQDMAKSLAPLVKVPGDAELWFDVVDMPLLREDAKDQAEIDLVKTQSIQALVNAGFEPETAVRVVAPEWIDTLRHTGMNSVQLQPPGVGAKNASGAQKLLDNPPVA